MGMYTEFVFGCSIKVDAPQEVISILRGLMWSGDDIPQTTPCHDFFKCARWKYIATSSSAYFGFSESNSCFKNTSCGMVLSIRSSIKNYDGEIEKFVDWIMPYVESGSGQDDFLGYKLYEESEIPILFYKSR